jgi:anti-sigma factor RsiW
MINSDSLLVAYVDGELDRNAALDVEAGLATDPTASESVEMFRETAALLRDAYGDRFFAGAGRVAGPPHRRALRQPRHGWAIAASLVAAIVGFGGGVTWSGRTPSERVALIDEVASDHHIYSRETKHLVEVPADQVAHLTAWLGQRLDRKLEAPDLVAAGLRFAGGRMLVVNDRPVAELMYTRDQGLPIGVYVTQMAGDTSPISVDQRGLERLATWIAGGYAYVVAGEIDDPTAQDIARRVASQIKS